MFEIREATPDDALGITIVNVYTWQTAYHGLMPEAAIHERIADLPARAEKTKEGLLKHTPCLVATIDHTVIGFCFFGASRNEAYSEAGEIFALYVLKGYAGAGVGKALFSGAMEAIARRGHRRLLINCLQGNPSRGFYEHMGGRVVGQRTDELFNTTITEDMLLFDIATR